MEKLPKVSLVIAAYNEEKDIKDLLNSLMKLDYPRNKLEIIVVDDGSTDSTPEIIRKYPVKIIKGPHRGVGFARNLGWHNSKGDIIFFIDADLILHPNFLRQVVKLYEDPNIAGVDYMSKPFNKKSLISRLLQARKILGTYQSEFTIATSLRRKILDEFGGINPSYGYYDDWELSRRIINKGYKTVLAWKAKLLHKEPDNWKDLYRQCKWSGKSMVFSFIGHKKDAVRRIMFPLICASLPIYIVLLFFQFPLWIFGLMGLLLFLFVEIKRSIGMYKYLKDSVVFLTPLFDCITMIMTFYGILLGILNYKSVSKGV